MAFIIGFYIWIQGRYVVPILMYHSISSGEVKSLTVFDHPLKGGMRLLNVTPQSFDRQMAFLKNNGYQVISLDDYVQGVKEGRKFSHKTVVITFDDGYWNNYTDAFPILKKYHFPATVFLISDFISANASLLTWEQVKEMSQNGISFGSHTRHHVYLPSLTEEQMKDEIIESKRVIEQHLGKPVYFFTYPTGGFNEKIKAIIASAGYQAALTTNRGNHRDNTDLYELRRIHINNWDNESTLRAKVSGYYNLFRSLRPSCKESK